jgi:hypothetical protein
MKETQTKLFKERIEAWNIAAPELARTRHKEIINADTARAIIAFERPFQSALIHHGLRPTSGLVRLQKILKLLAGKGRSDIA